MRRLATTIQAGGRALLTRLDAFFDRLYGSRYNPLYQSGTVAIAALVILLATGLYLLIFYRIGAPWASVERITDQLWTGRWIRSLHRYASAVAVVATVVHALRMFVQNRTWGPRALAWISGLVLTFVLLVCGWTGYVMVWDTQAHLLAAEGARFLDVLPIFSEPISRAFVGETVVPDAFFFLNLFLHVALPIGVALILWIHVSRVARPALLPPRKLLWGITGLLLVVSVAWPVGMAPRADLLSLPDRTPIDLFYAFFLPLTRDVPAGWVWVLGGGLGLMAVAVPFWARPKEERRPAPSFVDERLCTGCEQCFVDCPYEAISMVGRSDGRDGLVALVDPDLCVSCGICAGSCAPMGVGPPGRTGRDQIGDVRAFLERRGESLGAGDVVLLTCDRGSGGVGALDTFDGAAVYPVGCAGSVHTSVVELLVRSGVGGVLVVSCPPRDCWNRLGPEWVEGRLFHDREAELQPRVDRRRVRLVHAGAGERSAVAAALDRFRREVRALERARREEDPELLVECEVPVHDEPGDAGHRHQVSAGEVDA